MKIILLLGFLILSFSAVSNVPTVESLFRNGSSDGPAPHGVMILAEVSREETGSDMFYLKIWFAGKNGNDITQAVYSQKDTVLDSLLDIATKDNFISDFQRRGLAGTDRELFYSVLATLFLNTSAPMSNFMKKVAPEYKTNLELLDPEKTEILKKYKALLEEYASADKKRRSELDQMEEVKKAKVVLKEGLYAKTNVVRLIRKDKEFYWEVSFPKFKALVSNEKHQIYRVEYIDGANNQSVTVSGYAMSEGAHEAPRLIVVAGADGRSWKLRLLKMEVSSDKKNSKEFGRIFDKASIKGKSFQKPSFLI